MLPIDLGAMKIMSLGFLLRNQDDAVIWRGPMKAGVIKQFLSDVVWGDLDYLIIDSPPGTGDEPLSICQLIGALDGAVIVTTPQKVATVDVRKSITFCRQLQVPVLGVVENMSGFVCPKCGEVTQILSSGGGKRMAEDMMCPVPGLDPDGPENRGSLRQRRGFCRSSMPRPRRRKSCGKLSSPSRHWMRTQVEEKVTENIRQENKTYEDCDSIGGRETRHAFRTLRAFCPY